jgi:hypothetical protein
MFVVDKIMPDTLLEPKKLGPHLEVLLFSNIPVAIVESGYMVYYSFNILGDFDNRNRQMVSSISTRLSQMLYALKEYFGNRSVELSPDKIDLLYKTIVTKNITTLLGESCLLCTGEDICYCTVPYIERKYTTKESISSTETTVKHSEEKTTPGLPPDIANWFS